MMEHTKNHEQGPAFTVERVSPETIDAANEMRLESWLDTYVNDEHGITREWVEERNEVQRSAASRERRLAHLKDPLTQGWIAKDVNGLVIGQTSPFTDKDGVQHVGSLYVSKDWHGKGVASQLMQKVIDFLDSTKPIELSVATYNERAKAFYRKWGFEEVPGPETLFADKVPQVKMVRPAQT